MKNIAEKSSTPLGIYISYTDWRDSMETPLELHLPGKNPPISLPFQHLIYVIQILSTSHVKITIQRYSSQTKYLSRQASNKFPSFIKPHLCRGEYLISSS